MASWIVAALLVAPWCSPASQHATLATAGKALFFSTSLSADRTVACASCHDPNVAFATRDPLSIGVLGRKGRRNAPTLINALAQKSFFWDGRAETPHDQLLGPLLDADEMALPNTRTLVQRVRDDPALSAAMRAAGEAPDLEAIQSALVAYECTLQGTNTPFDRFLRGDTEAISEQARAGWELFNGKAMCNKCHGDRANPGLLTDHGYHNLGIGQGEGFAQPAMRAAHLGRMAVTQQSADLGAFRTPMLRNVGVTAPYMHDGSLATLYDVMDHYNRGGDVNPRLDSFMRPLNLSEDEIDAMVAWMFSLSDTRFAILNAQEQARQNAMKEIRPERVANLQ